MSERPRIEDLVRSWVDKAEHDLLNIENNLAAKEIPWDTVGFHAQQCGEKYLKALLVFHRVDFPKIHDLRDDIPASGSQSNETKRFAPSRLHEPFVTPFAARFQPPV